MEIPSSSRYRQDKRTGIGGMGRRKRRARLCRGLACGASLAMVWMASSASADIRFVASGHLGAAFANDLTLDFNPNSVAGGAFPGIPPEPNPIGQSQPGYSIGGSIGAQFGNWIRWDVFDLSQIGTTQNFVSPGASPNREFSVNASMLVYGTSLRIGRFSPEARWRPFISVGVGAANTQLNTPPTSIIPFFVTPLATVETFKGWGLEWDLGVGLEYPFSERGAAALRFRYRQSDVTFRASGQAPDADLNDVPAFLKQTKQIRVFTLSFELSFIGP